MSSPNADYLSDYKNVTSSDEEYTLRHREPSKPASLNSPKAPTKPSQRPGPLKLPKPDRILCTPLYASTSPPTVAQACASFFDAQKSLADGPQIWKARAAEEKRVVPVAEDGMSFGVYEEWGEKMCVQKYWIEETSGKGNEGRKKDGGKRGGEEEGGKARYVKWADAEQDAGKEANDGEKD
jgi:hypothetical protein